MPVYSLAAFLGPTVISRLAIAPLRIILSERYKVFILENLYNSSTGSFLHILFYAVTDHLDMSDNVSERRIHRTNTSRRALDGKRRTGTTAAHLPSPKRRMPTRMQRLCTLIATAVILPTTVAQNCISLADSTECRAFSSASVSTDSTLTGLFPFLSNVTDTTSFDTQLQQFISNGFNQQRYQNLIGCSSFDSANSSDYYARYTTSVLCNAIVQNSISPCDLTGNATLPLCASTCVRE